MIDINKRYRTRDGRKVVLYTVNGVDKGCPVVGEQHAGGLTYVYKWTSDGKSLTSDSDLIEDTNEIECDMYDDSLIRVEKEEDGVSIWVSEDDPSVVFGVHLFPTKTRQLIQMLQEAIDD